MEAEACDRQDPAAWSQNSAIGGVHMVVGRALEELQAHVTAEVRRLQSLLDKGPLRAPQGDAPVPEPTNRTSQCLVSNWQKQLKTPPKSMEVKATVSSRGNAGLRAKNSSKGDSFGGFLTGGVYEKAHVQAGVLDMMTNCVSEGSELHHQKARECDSRYPAKARRVRTPPSRVRKLVGTPCFELFWIIIVVLNSILLGVQTQWASMNVGKDEPAAFMVLQHVFSFMFLIELSLRIKALGCIQLFTGPAKAWAILDLIIVVASLVEFFVEIALSTTVNSADFRAVRIVRLARFFRALRVERIIHLVSGLRTLVISILGTLKALMWSLLLLFILMYMVGITLTQVVVDFAWEGNSNLWGTMGLVDYWGRLDVSMFTLFQAISGGVSWREAVLPLENISILLVWLFVAYVSFTYFAVLNVMTGVFCNAAIESAQRNPDVIARNLQAQRKMYVRNLEKLFHTVDEDDDAIFTYSEFEQIITNPENRAYLAALEIEAKDAWTLFKLMDADKDGIIHKSEFIQGCLQLKGVAKNIEIANLSRDVGNLERRLHRFMSLMDECRDLLRRTGGPVLPLAKPTSSWDSRGTR